MVLHSFKHSVRTGEAGHKHDGEHESLNVKEKEKESQQSTSKKGLKRRKTSIKAANRIIHLNKPGQKFPSNYISTTKYTFYTFVPYFLFEQFRRYSNLFFLFIVIIQQIPDVSPTGRWTTLIPLTFILTVSACREIFEDYRRKKSDIEKNNRKVMALRDHKWIWIKWAEVQVGDFVKITDESYFPADIILISTSDPESNCFIETSNLDGETNLKTRKCFNETSHNKHGEQLTKMQGYIEAEAPNRHLYEFTGRFRITGQHGHGSKELPLSANQLLLRGARLENTEWVIGVVVYTGSDTKLMKNSTKARLKRSQLDIVTNHMVFFLLLLLVILSAISTVMSIMTEENDVSKNKYINGPRQANRALAFILTFLTFVILYNNLIPISLTVTLELVRFYQAHFIEKDLDMYHARSDSPCLVKCANLNEELGQVSFVFSDKTGTLTENIMEFIKCSVAGDRYNKEELFGNDKHSSDLIKRLQNKKTSFDQIRKDKKRKRTASSISSKDAQSDHGDDPNIISNQEEKSRIIKDFLILLSICHEVVPEKKKVKVKNVPTRGPSVVSSKRRKSEKKSGKKRKISNESAKSEKESEGKKSLAVHDDNDLHYNSASPDERALVDGAKKLGFTFLHRSQNTMDINVFGNKEKFEILKIIEFTSTRKRMSVIIRDSKGRIRLFCKGADNVILERLDSVGKSDPLRDRTIKHLEKYAREGLRTLCCAVRELNQEEYESWRKGFEKAEVSVDDRENKVALAAEQIERKLHLLGATAIEDKLQDKVPETIHELLLAGIRIWVLTGDKQETAINIGHSCQLLEPGMELLVVNENEPHATETAIINHLKHIVTKYPKFKDMKKVPSEPAHASVIIDGKSLKYVLGSKRIKKEFLSLCLLCKTVICCRVSPLQKAEVVEMVTQRTGKVTLAIGDGANDVAMIQKAHVGVGISGNEGLQAASAADYSIAQFKYLKKLLLVHGAWSYDRMLKTILYSFYKNIAFYMIEFWFAIYSAWSGQILFEQWTIALFNVVFTASQPLVLGIFDQNCKAEFRMKYPGLYKYMKNRFNLKIFSLIILNAILHSIIIFWLCLLIAGHQVFWSEGHTGSIFVLGNFVYGCVVVVVSLKAGLMSSSWNIFTHLSIWGSIIAWFVVVLVYSYVADIELLYGFASNFYGMSNMLFTSALFWFTILFVSTATLVPDLMFTTFKDTYKPYKEIELRQREQKGGKKYVSICCVKFKV